MDGQKIIKVCDKHDSHPTEFPYYTAVVTDKQAEKLKELAEQKGFEVYIDNPDTYFNVFNFLKQFN